MEFVRRSGSKATYTDIAHIRTYHIGGIDGVDGNLVAGDGKGEAVADAWTDNTQQHLCALGTTQALHDLLLRHLDTCNGGIVDADNAVASQDAHLLGRTAADGLDDEQGVFHHIELYTDTFEVALQGLVHVLYFFGRRIGGVGVQLLQHATDAILYQLILVDRFYVIVFYHLLSIAKFQQRRLFACAKLKLSKAYIGNQS